MKFKFKVLRNIQNKGEYIKYQWITTQNMLQNEGYMLNQENYLFCFANFLLGRDIYGPGKYIFGVFDNREMNEKYQIIYNEEDE